MLEYLHLLAIDAVVEKQERLTEQAFPYLNQRDRQALLARLDNEFRVLTGQFDYSDEVRERMAAARRKAQVDLERLRSERRKLDAAHKEGDK